MYEADSDILSLIIIFQDGMTNISVQNFAIWIPYVKTVPKSLRKLKMLNKIDIYMKHLCWCLHSVR